VTLPDVDSWEKAADATDSVSVSVAPSAVAEMVAVPEATARIHPESETVIAPGSDDSHAMGALETSCLCWSYTFAASRTDPFRIREATRGYIEIDEAKGDGGAVVSEQAQVTSRDARNSD